jgi:hypothetical protein
LYIKDHLLLAFFLNIGLWISLYNASFFLNHSRSTDSVLLGLKFNFFWSGWVVAHCWSMFFFFATIWFNINTGNVNYSFLMICSFSETDNTVPFIFVFVVMHAAIYNTQVNLLSHFTKFNTHSSYVNYTQRPHYQLDGQRSESHH